MIRVALTLLLVALSSTAAWGIAKECRADWEELPAEQGGRILLQVQAKKISSPEFSATVAWYASPFGDCITGCNSRPFQTRMLECRTVYDDQPAPAHACAGPKPAAVVAKCSCELQVCRNVSSSKACPPIDDIDGEVDTGGYKTVGCVDFDAPSTALENPPYEATCKTWNKIEPCLGGLPFYAYRENGMDEGKCYRFCMQKGMDIFGIQGGAVCRCGASLSNTLVWHAATPRPGLAFKPSAVMPSGRTGCPLKVYRYTGHYEAGGTPSVHWQIKEQDLEYTDSIVSARDSSEAKEDGSPLDKMKNWATVLQSEEQQGDPTGFNRSCWPENCGPGKPWPYRSAKAPAGGAQVWDEYVTIDYVFDLDVGLRGKAAFRAAADEWMKTTCIRLIEGTGSVVGKAYINVGIYDPYACWSNTIGWTSFSKINLGWCNDLRHKGSIIHEIGHALGMHHEQTRPDASSNYAGHGPFLKLNWEHLPSAWVPRQTRDGSPYTESANDAVKDPHSAYDDYDFGSIMHYSARQNEFDKIPADEMQQVGNRELLSVGDIMQINDMYQCKKCRSDFDLTIYSASGLKDEDWIGVSDPFVVLIHKDPGGEQKAEFTTRVQEETTDPKWDHKETIKNFCAEDGLQIVVYDEDCNACKPDFLGSLVLTAKQIPPNGVSKSFDLTPNGSGRIYIKIEPKRVGLL